MDWEAAMRRRIVLAALLGLIALPAAVRAEGFGFGFGFGDERREHSSREERGRSRRDDREHSRYEERERDERRRSDDERPSFGFGFSFGSREEEPPSAPSYYFPDDGEEGMTPPPDEGNTMEDPPAWSNVDDGKKPEKIVKKQALVVGVGFGVEPTPHDKEISIASTKQIDSALRAGWGFKQITLLVNEVGTKKNIMQGLDDLIANAKNTNPKTLEAYYVVVHLQGHAFPTVAANSIGDALKGVAKPDQPQIAFRAAEAKLDTSNLGLILAYELQSKLTELASALAALEGNGAKTYLIVNIDCCWAERFFDGWGGGAGKAKLPGNIYGGWSAGTDSKSKVEGSANGANLTPFTQGFDGALGLDDDGRQKSATVQDAQKAGADKANDAGDKPAKNASDVKTTPPQGAGSAAPGGAAPVDPGAHGKGI